MRKELTSIFRFGAVVAFLGSATLVHAQAPAHNENLDGGQTPLDRHKHPEYNGIGIVKSDVGRGTGWLANECIVWTAKHVMGRNKRAIGQRVQFLVGQSETGTADFQHTVSGVVVESGNARGDQYDGGADDWALIKLGTPIGRKVGYIPVAQYSVEDALACQTLEVAGFPGHKSMNHLWWEGPCILDVKYSDPTGFTLSCAGPPGLSGGPLLCRESDGKLYAIGIVNQHVKRGRALVVNFTYDWAVIKPAFQRVMNTCK